MVKIYIYNAHVLLENGGGGVATSISGIGGGRGLSGQEEAAEVQQEVWECRTEWALQSGGAAGLVGRGRGGGGFSVQQLCRLQQRQVSHTESLQSL